MANPNYAANQGRGCCARGDSEMIVRVPEICGKIGRYAGLSGGQYNKELRGSHKP